MSRYATATDYFGGAMYDEYTRFPIHGATGGPVWHLAFGVEMSEDRQNAIFAFIPATYAMIALVVELTRARVSSPATVQRLKETGGR